MSQLLSYLKDMPATNWSLIIFWNESKGQVARSGPDIGLDFTDHLAPTPAQPPQPLAAGKDVDYPGYDNPHGDMPADDEPEPDLDNDPVELHTGGDPPHNLPEAALRCRYRKMIMTIQTWKCRWIRRATEAISH